MSEVATSGDLKENLAYSLHRHHSRGSLPSPLIVVNPLVKGRVPQEVVYETIPGEYEEPVASNISPLEEPYELMNPIDGDKPPEIGYDAVHP